MNTRQDAIEWHKANLQREQDRLATMEAACGSAEAVSRNSLVMDQRRKVAMIEKMLAANVPLDSGT